ncbi:nucleoporin 85 [Heterostelium album PN500]|uniref:Nuclear pore complex protein Nup85 n=1 Tax=Heterostelium pallidum (strain ATCC 26659 / Pp 5 / PN500) TaxID=670386 RepID=D3BKE5_HETP5|nr:nucleoporin 85 [Heterostelium album PN500]EFA78375.1 nucleoporin 85 [Heterostelium album PN500]|eukprot:XP_020430500.1 nucleoporin 85 [Heterostelium album PN500]
MYSHFKTLQSIDDNGSDSMIPDERVREISAISNRYQSVLLATIDQIQKSLDSGNYLDYDDSSQQRENPFDEDLVIKEKTRIVEIMKESKESKIELIIFCGSVNSIYPLLCAKVSRELGIKCNLIARESLYEVKPQYQMALKGIQSMLTILTPSQYSQRIKYIEDKYQSSSSSQSNNITYVECDDLYQKYKYEYDNLQVLSIIWKIAHLFYFSPAISPYQLIECLHFDRQSLHSQFVAMTSMSVLETDEGYQYKHFAEISPLANIRDNLIVDYAQYLASDQSLVEVACNYLLYTKNGPFIIDQIIQRQPISSEKQALKLLEYCQSQDTQRFIYRMLSMEDYKNQRYASALSWLMKGKDSERISQLSTYLLNEKLDSNLLDDLQSLVETKLNEIQYYRELDFLIKYKELITLWKNFDDYSKCFCGMLRDKVVPKPFWIRLLLDIVPLLESSKKVYFGYDDTILLLNCLEEICSPHLIDQYLEGVSDSEIQTLRLALARNVSKSFIFANHHSNISNSLTTINNTTAMITPYSPSKFQQQSSSSPLQLNNGYHATATSSSTTPTNIINSTIFTMNK